MSEGKKIVIVTGAAGFIGSHVAYELLKRGDRVIGVDEMNDYYDISIKKAAVSSLVPFPDFTMYYGDICDYDFIANVFKVENPTHVCHLAARAGVRPSIDDPYIYVHSNVEGTTRMLDLSRLYQVENFVFASSSSVYGSSTKDVLSEADAVDNPVSPYAATKKSCELLGYTFHHLYGLNVTGLRFFTVYGPRGRPDMAPFKFIDRIYHGLEIQQYGDGSTSRDYTYISDITNGVILSIDRPLGYQIFNLGNGVANLLSDFIKLVEDEIGHKALVKVCPEQPGDVPRTCACIAKAKEMLDYNPVIPFADGIRLTVEWYKSAVAELDEYNDQCSNIEVTDSDKVDSELDTDDESLRKGTATIKTAKKGKPHRVETDLELSSNVEKATARINIRSGRYVSTINQTFNCAYVEYYQKMQSERILKARAAALAAQVLQENATQALADVDELAKAFKEASAQAEYAQMVANAASEASAALDEAAKTLQIDGSIEILPVHPMSPSTRLERSRTKSGNDLESLLGLSSLSGKSP